MGVGGGGPRNGRGLDVDGLFDCAWRHGYHAAGDRHGVPRCADEVDHDRSEGTDGSHEAGRDGVIADERSPDESGAKGHARTAEKTAASSAALGLAEPRPQLVAHLAGFERRGVGAQSGLELPQGLALVTSFQKEPRRMEVRDGE